MTRRFVVTGTEGQVVRCLIERGGLQDNIEIVRIGRPQLDLAALQTLEASIVATKPDAIISAAAYTAVDRAETDEENAFYVNAKAVGEIGRIGKLLNVPIVHLSTDYVFDGQKTAAYCEDDLVNPVSVYGRSKLEGERLLAASGADHVILRTAWVYSPFGRNFIKTMLQLAETREQIGVVADQTGNPTSALDIADAIIKVTNNLIEFNDANLRGIFHMCGTGETNWADFARQIFEISAGYGGPVANINSLTTAEYPTKAARPKNSCLECSKLGLAHKVVMPPWQTSTAVTVKRLISH
ncbi:dTDP-4-dehydrorhamnose reductase [Rhizobium soli]|uniref:dTDP-4-dehydrorhamnose reductase n=1 Tax=Rhizobium soli TaxID=424798 RepID=A0A7X0MVA8_9HYPH|nr:dTDP-4-dehydrorhamnose reductase [Rhizobium soli]MBB6511130.1 dTDP-4-dehydrorhamnose reductase [Rhizobium soli]